MGSLILASRDTVSTRPNDIAQDVMNNSFLPGPDTSNNLPGTAPSSGVHYNCENGSILERFPTDILDKILVNLDPIWLFQLELAVPNIALYLTHPDSNPIWYETLPASIFCSPECFQNKRQHLLPRSVVIDQGSDRGQDVEGHTVTISEVDRHRLPIKDLGLMKNKRNPTRTKKNETALAQFGNKKEIALPQLHNCSSMAEEASRQPSADATHRMGTSQYPLVKGLGFPSQPSYRPRNLALGGPYQDCLSYRREVLGYLHTGKRCDLCLGISTELAPVAVKVAGFRFCTNCLGMWTIQPSNESGEVIDYVKEHLPLIRSDNDGWEHSVHVPLGMIPGRVLVPLVDHVVRQRLGIDYYTAKAKEGYLGRLRLLKNKETKFAADCCKIRLLIVDAAERLYKGTKVKLPAARVEYWSKTFLPASRLREVLFAPEALDRDALLLPHTSKAKYPRDQTLIQIDSSSDATLTLRDPEKIRDMAFLMVMNLLTYPDKSTRLVELATEYHIKRLRSTFTLEGVKQGRDKISANPGQYAPFGSPPALQYTRAINSILAKLCLEPDNKTKQLRVDDAGKQAAMKTLPRILESACIVCPASGYLAGRGIERVVEHVRTHHYSLFWGDALSGSREEFFKIIG